MKRKASLLALVAAAFVLGVFATKLAASPSPAPSASSPSPGPIIAIEPSAMSLMPDASLRFSPPRFEIDAGP